MELRLEPVEAGPDLGGEALDLRREALGEDIVVRGEFSLAAFSSASPFHRRFQQRGSRDLQRRRACETARRGRDSRRSDRKALASEKGDGESGVADVYIQKMVLS